jgi:hypothetical protein
MSPTPMEPSMQSNGLVGIGAILSLLVLLIMLILPALAHATPAEQAYSTLGPKSASR